MVILTNPDLMSAMQNSYVLQQNLSEYEINILIEKAFELGQKAQKKLLEKFTEEKIDVKLHTFKNKDENRKKLKQYQLDIIKIITDFKKITKKHAEQKLEQQNKTDIITLENTLKNL